MSDGLNPASLGFLRESYRLGPNEGWIMVTRNRLALTIFPSLPADLADQSLDEFARLLQPGFVSYAADILTGPGWPLRDRLLARIETAPEPQRRALAEILRDRGYDAKVPGIVDDDERHPR